MVTNGKAHLPIAGLKMDTGISWPSSARSCSAAALVRQYVLAFSLANLKQIGEKVMEDALMMLL
jgi:hypothetical protein